MLASNVASHEVCCRIYSAVKAVAETSGHQASFTQEASVNLNVARDDGEMAHSANEGPKRSSKAATASEQNGRRFLSSC